MDMPIQKFDFLKFLSRQTELWFDFSTFSMIGPVWVQYNNPFYPSTSQMQAQRGVFWELLLCPSWSAFIVNMQQKMSLIHGRKKRETFVVWHFLNI